jgi:hypothetical protein
MTTNTVLDTATTALTVSEGGTGNNSSAYVAAYDLLLSNSSGVSIDPIYDLAAIGATGTNGQWLLDNNSFANPNWVNIVGRLLSKQVLTSGTGATYTPTSAAVTTLIVELIGAGGGGGGVTGSSTTYAASTGGTSGQYIVGNQYIVAGPFTYTVGAGGLHGSGTAAGNTGSSTTFGTLTAVGGRGGNGSSGTATATGAFTNPSPNSLATPAGLGAGQRLAQYGFVSSVICVAGDGGGSFYGGSILGPTLTSAGTTAGNVGAAYGGGGSGCCSYLDSTNTSQVGGAGSAGVIIVWEYS